MIAAIIVAAALNIIAIIAILFERRDLDRASRELERAARAIEFASSEISRAFIRRSVSFDSSHFLMADHFKPPITQSHPC